MKYYLVAGEASGDLHASRLMQALRQADPEARFRFFGGDMMAAVGGTCVMHYRQMAYMGFVPVLLHLPAILRNMRLARRDIASWRPDAVILVDYPGFNLRLAKYVKSLGHPKVYYYIAPKIWAWKEYRIKSIKRYVDELFSILPFEVDFFEGRHHFPIHYVGNPTADEVDEFLASRGDGHGGEPVGDGRRPVIALLAGSRRQEIKDNLPAMIKATARYAGTCDVVVAGAPGIDDACYDRFVRGTGVRVVHGQTYQLLAEARAALVTSGTATLETALMGVPQVVCYETPLPRLVGWLKRRVLSVRHVSLVNLIAGREVVPELVADSFTLDNIERCLDDIMHGDARRQMLDAYGEVRRRLGRQRAPVCAAETMVALLRR